MANQTSEAVNTVTVTLNEDEHRRLLQLGDARGSDADTIVKRVILDAINGGRTATSTSDESVQTSVSGGKPAKAGGPSVTQTVPQDQASRQAPSPSEGGRGDRDKIDGPSTVTTKKPR